MNKIKALFLVAVSFVGMIPLVCRGQSAEANRAAIDTITSRLTARYLTGKGDVAAIQEEMNSMAADGSWADVNYVDSAMASWKPMAHLERLKAMAIAWREPNSRFYHNEVLKSKIMLGLDYYLKRQPQSRNWWYRDIGAPQVYMVALLMLKGNIPQPDLIRYADFLKDATSNKSHQGKNRSWVSEITIYKGCIEDHIDLIDRGFRSVASTLVIDTLAGGEGIKTDWSFHQHHAQLYSGGYGLSLISDYAAYLLLARQTRFAADFTPAKRGLLTNLLLEGHQRLAYRNTMDFGTIGRDISRKNNGGSVSLSLLAEMADLDTVHRSAYRAWQEHLSGAPYPQAYQGNYHFWLSDMMTQHGANYYFSAKIISKRTLGTESLNGENIKGYNLPLGATNIIVRGDEYHNISPVWNWSRVPGTTTELNDSATHLEGYIYGNNAFGGGVSNGAAGLTAFSSDYHGIHAKKAYFFMDGAMICLGAGITASKEHAVVTSVNQCLANGSATADNGGHWIYQDSVGYIFPQSASMKWQQTEQRGTWRSISANGAPDTIVQKVFSIWLDHGTQPVDATYQYLVVPGKSLEEFKTFQAGNAINIVKNDTTIQAIHSSKSKTYAAVFYRTGSVKLGDTLQVSANAAVLLLIQQTSNGYAVSCADPLYNQSGVMLNINSQDHYIKFPMGQFTGKTVTFNYPAK